MNANTNISVRYFRSCPGRYPPSERVKKDGYWTLRVVPIKTKIPDDIKTDGSAGDLDQTIFKVW